MPLVQSRVPMIQQDILGGRAWSHGLGPAEWVVPVSRACLEEIDTVVRTLRASGTGSIEALEPTRCPLASCGQLMRTVRDKLVDGPGLAVVDRVPVEQYSAEESKAIGWLLAGMLGLQLEFAQPVPLELEALCLDVERRQVRLLRLRRLRGAERPLRAGWFWRHERCRAHPQIAGHGLPIDLEFPSNPTLRPPLFAQTCNRIDECHFELIHHVVPLFQAALERADYVRIILLINGWFSGAQTWLVLGAQ